MDRHLLALTQIMLVTSQLMSHLLDGKAAPQESTSLTVLGEDQIGGVEGSCSADT